MANITRFDPFHDVARFDPFRDMDTLSGFGKLRRFFKELPAEPTIKLEVTENDKSYTVKADLPGVRKEDIDVQVDGNEVFISAEVKREKEEKKDATLVHTERYYGRQFRSFILERDIDRKGVAAKFNDGVLELTLPKNGKPASDRIAIQ